MSTDPAAPEPATPDPAVPDPAAANPATREAAAPDPAAANPATREAAAPDPAVTNPATREAAAPDPAAANPATREAAVPTPTAPDTATPDLAVTNPAMREAAVPNLATPDPAVPDPAAANPAMREAAVPNPAATDPATREAAVPTPTAPDTAVPDLATPDLAVTSPATPDPTAPDKTTATPVTVGTPAPNPVAADPGVFPAPPLPPSAPGPAVPDLAAVDPTVSHPTTASPTSPVAPNLAGPPPPSWTAPASPGADQGVAYPAPAAPTSGVVPPASPPASGPTPPPGPVRPDPLPAPPAPSRAARRRFLSARAWPLWARLAAITTALVAAGLLLAGVLSTTLLRQFLVDQVDTKLTAQGEVTAQMTLSQAMVGGDRRGPIPTDYAVQVGVGDDSTLYLGDWVADRYGVPNLPQLTGDEARATGRQPFTVSADGSSATWRAVAYPVQVDQQPGGRAVGSVVVALPLGDVEQTTRQMTTVLLASGAAIVLVAALAGALAVRRSLRPLRQIEATAAAIAAGDLSRRVPTAPLSTEVGRLGAALNGMLAQIERAFADRSASEARMRRFVADASHELRTPLAAVRGYAELYRTGGPTALDGREALARVEESAIRMGVLVEDLLTLARLDEGPSQGRPARREPVDMVVLAGDALSDLHALDPTRQVRLVGLSGEVEPCPVLGDEHQLRQVLTNLVGNITRHTPKGSPVELAIGHDYAARPCLGIVEVRDHGPGIAPEHAARVFERFYRVDPSRTRDSGGSGLGMAIVAAVVEAHQGDVAVVETPGGGTTIRVRIPLAGPPPMADLTP